MKHIKKLFNEFSLAPNQVVCYLFVMNKNKVLFDFTNKSNHNMFLNQMQATPAAYTKMLFDGNPLSEKSKAQIVVL